LNHAGTAIATSAWVCNIHVKTTAPKIVAEDRFKANSGAGTTCGQNGLLSLERGQFWYNQFSSFYLKKRKYFLAIIQLLIDRFRIGH